MSRHSPIRPLLAPNPPPPHLLASGPPLHLLPPAFFDPGPELQIAGYKCSTHVFPAAWPRSTHFAPVPRELEGGVGEGKEAAKERFRDATGAMLKLQIERTRPSGVKPGDERVFWLTATRWVRASRKHGRADKTLVCTHAAGMHGQTFAPLVRHLLRQRADIAEVWTLDGVQHGDAGLLNAGKLGGLFDWVDAARDALCFLRHFLPADERALAPLPTCLELAAPGSVLARRRVHGLGHSYGAGTIARASSQYPDLFAAIMLVDPAFGSAQITGLPSLKAFVGSAVSRDDEWPTRAAAHAALRANPFFSSWDPEVFDIYVACALAERAPGGAITLKCTRGSEAAVFSDPIGSIDSWHSCPAVDVHIPMLWINPPPKKSIIKTESNAQARVRLRPTNCAHVVIPDGTHLLVQTNPRQVADAVHTFLQAVDQGTVGNEARELRLPYSPSPEMQGPGLARL